MGLKSHLQPYQNLLVQRNLYSVRSHRVLFLPSVTSLLVGNVTESGKIHSELGFLFHILCYLKNIQLLAPSIIFKLVVKPATC